MKDFNTQLTEIKQEIRSYLDLKREAFHNFYFLSNNDIINLIARSNSLNIIKSEISNIFFGIKSLQIQDKTIQAVIGDGGEQFTLVKPLNTLNKSVEVWLKELKDIIKAHLVKITNFRDIDFRQLQQQIVININIQTADFIAKNKV